MDYCFSQHTVLPSRSTYNETYNRPLEIAILNLIFIMHIGMITHTKSICMYVCMSRVEFVENFGVKKSLILVGWMAEKAVCDNDRGRQDYTLKSGCELV